MPAVLRRGLLCLALLVIVGPALAQERAPARATKTVRLLTVGNSFSQNATRYLPDIVKAAGHVLVHRQASMGGATLAQHWDKAQWHEQDAADKRGLYASQKSLKQELRAGPWDFITIQQASIKSHDVETYRPYARLLRDYIAKHAPEAEVLVHQTWAYRQDDPRFHAATPAPGEPRTQQEMHQGLTHAYETIAAELGARLIPVGDAFHLADTDVTRSFRPDQAFDVKNAKAPALPGQKHSLHVGWRWTKDKAGTTALRMDGHHANTAGEYLGACVFYAMLLGESPVGNSFVPPGVDAEHARFLQETAQRAVQTRAQKSAGGGLKLLEVRKIWDQTPHNAFTDLVRFQDRWFCVFREGKAHVSPDGALRVIASPDGVKWESAALVTSPHSDLRDAKIVVTPKGELMLSGAEALHDKSKHTHQSLAWFSRDGRSWSERHDIGDPNLWLWRVTWHKDSAYGIGYGCGQDKLVRLYRSKDGKKFDTLVDRLLDEGYPNETALVFSGDTCYCLLRRDGKPSTGLIGVAQAPYTDWHWRDLGVRIGGPHMVRLEDGRFLAAVRLYDGKVRTSLCWIEPAAGKLTEALKLPSGGDTSYAGLVLHDGLLWVSYYSSHEGKTSIYLAKVQVAGSL